MATAKEKPTADGARKLKPASNTAMAGGRSTGRNTVAAPRALRLVSFRRLVQAEAPVAGSDAVRAIREGYPATILKDVSAFFDVPESRIQKIAHVPATTAHRLQQRQGNVDAGASERVLRISEVTRMAIEVFGDEEAAKGWLREPNLALHNEAPLDLLDTEPGAVTIKQILNAIQTGGPV